MKKADLVDAITNKMKVVHDRPVSKTDVSAFLESLGDVCQSALISGKELSLPGIGKLTVTERSARTGRNPKTGETIEIAASKSAKFAVTRSLKEALNT